MPEQNPAPSFTKDKFSQAANVLDGTTHFLLVNGPEEIHNSMQCDEMELRQMFLSLFDFDPALARVLCETCKTWQANQYLKEDPKARRPLPGNGYSQITDMGAFERAMEKVYGVKFLDVTPGTGVER